MAKITNRIDFYVLLVTMTLYLTNRILKAHISYPVFDSFMRCHFNDYIGGIVICSIINIIVYHYKNKYIRIRKLTHYIVIGIICSFMWEVIAPMVLPYSTADWFDCVMYLTGTITYYFFNIIYIKMKST